MRRCATTKKEDPSRGGPLIYVDNLELSIDNEALYDAFSGFGIRRFFLVSLSGDSTLGPWSRRDAARAPATRACCSTARVCWLCTSVRLFRSRERARVRAMPVAPPIEPFALPLLPHRTGCQMWHEDSGSGSACNVSLRSREDRFTTAHLHAY